MFTAGSLFSGIGGIDVAFAAAGFDIRFQVEIDDYCRKVLTKHAPRYWPNATQFMDVRDVGSHNLPYVDVLFGGFPCQDISIAGNGAGLAGARSGLWYEFRRIIGEIRPGVVFLENVPAITHRGGTDVIAHLTEMGYDTRWGIVGAADAGAPHQRHRWWCVAYDMCGRPDEQTTLADSETNRVGDIPPYSAQWGAIADAAFAGSEDVSNATGGGRRRRGDHRRVRYVPCHEERVSTQNEPERNRWVGWSKSDAFAQSQPGCASQPRLGRNNDGLSGWLDRPRFPAGSNQPQHAWEPPRQIESKPSNWAARVKALGNAVVPQVVYPFAVEIMRQLAEAESHGD